jgi:Spy/CpxP family protein refolding chaperone
MKLHKRAVAIGSVAAVLTLGTAGLVAAAGVQGNGPASALSGLVSDGTLTQAQADKVAEALKAQRDAMHKERQADRAEMEALVAKTLGISEADVQQAHKDGKSLADLAGDKRDELVAAMVAFANAKIDEGVKEGKLTQAQADKMKANTQKRVENRVDGKGGPGGKGHGGMRGGPDGAGFDGPDGDPAADAGAASPAA